MKVINTKDANFDREFAQLLERGKMDIDGVTHIVKNILDEIKNEGNEALQGHIAKFDNWSPSNSSELEVSVTSMEEAYNSIDPILSNTNKITTNYIGKAR